MSQSFKAISSASLSIASIAVLSVMLSGPAQSEPASAAWTKWFNPEYLPGRNSVASGIVGFTPSEKISRDAGVRAVAAKPANSSDRTVRGLVRPKSEAEISTDLVAPIVRIPFKFGKSFRKGEPLVIFNCDRYKAELAAARAEKRGQDITLKAKLHLQKLNVVGRNEVKIARANSDKGGGLVRPKSEAEISTDLVAPIVRIPFKFGKSFRKGEPLVIFNCDRYKAELAAARAEKRGQDITLKAKLHLQKLNAVGRNEVKIARANSDKATAEVQALSTRVKQCEIKAPYDGRVVEQRIEEHEVPKPNSPLLKIINDEDLRIELIVPSKWLTWLKEGARFRFEVAEMGQGFEATVDQIGAAVDPVSQTVRITGRFISRPKQVLAGMTGAADFGH